MGLVRLRSMLWRARAAADAFFFNAPQAWDNSPVARNKRGRGRPVEKRGKLGTWVDEHGWTRQQLADELGIKLASAARLCSGGGRPSLEMAVKIEDLTEGTVPVRYWLRIRAQGNG